MGARIEFDPVPCVRSYIMVVIPQLMHGIKKIRKGGGRRQLIRKRVRGRKASYG